MGKRQGVRGVWALALGAAALLAAPGAGASVIWDGDASRGLGIFKNIGSDGNCGAPSSIVAVNDATHGRVWRYTKPSASNRCENHGIKVGGQPFVFQNGQTYFLGWWARISSTNNNNANFQWKSFGDGHQQNFPVVLKITNNGEMTLMQRQPGGVETFLWRRRISANKWNHYALSLKLSNQTRGGFIEFWFNGVKQTFTTGGTRFACRTFDTGNHNCPKWGYYGGRGRNESNHVDCLRVGTTFEDVRPR
jgi:hypothetical protein